MTITTQIKLLPTAEQKALVDAAMVEYISLVNDIIDYAISLGSMPKLSSAKVSAPLPSALRAQCYMDAKSIWWKTLKHGGKFPTLKKPVAVWNNQNFKISTGSISFPVLINSKSERIEVKALITADALAIIQICKLGTLRITRKNGKYIAQIAHEAIESSHIGTKTMGVDLGIKCPAVVELEGGRTKFFGNGRRNKYVRRRYNTRRKKLGKAKKLNAIRKSNDKEQRWMRDQDHKTSREIVDFALASKVGTIKLEALSGIRSTTRNSRKNNHSLSNWSFYRLSQYIEYKAKLAGIAVEYVNPAYTSQTCPACGTLNKAKDRTYACGCGYRAHRDIVGARNILVA